MGKEDDIMMKSTSILVDLLPSLELFSSSCGDSLLTTGDRSTESHFGAPWHRRHGLQAQILDVFSTFCPHFRSVSALDRLRMLNRDALPRPAWLALPLPEIQDAETLPTSIKTAQRQA